MKAPKGWLVVGKRDSKIRGDWSVIVRASAVRRALGRADFPKMTSATEALIVARPPAPSKDRPPEGYRLFKGNGSVREVDRVFGGHSWAIPIKGGALDGSIVNGLWYGWPVARPIPARGRKKGGGK